MRDGELRRRDAALRDDDADLPAANVRAPPFILPGCRSPACRWGIIPHSSRAALKHVKFNPDCPHLPTPASWLDSLTQCTSDQVSNPCVAVALKEHSLPST